ncbi:hypothetical protein H2248_005413 [Termitomyces sp. 'cryptogamus']|nr:hypothetical protein H2248_005413 [Termitomyces sp. 'cryptogamus']
MSAVIRRVFDNLYSGVRKDEYTIIILGQPGSGKTTLFVPKIPSFGFNSETIEVSTTSGQPLKLVGWDFGFAVSRWTELSILFCLTGKRAMPLIRMG